MMKTTISIISGNPAVIRIREKKICDVSVKYVAPPSTPCARTAK